MTVFLRVLEASVDEKSEALLRAVASLHDHDKRDDAFQRAVFERKPASFSAVPGSPFAYWVSDELLRIFERFTPFESNERVAKGGMKTQADERFLRASWEVPDSATWVGLCKGGRFSRFYADVHLVTEWRDNGKQARAAYEHKVQGESWGGFGRNEAFYFRPGLTWPRRTNGLSFRAMPAGCIFADKGPAAFVDGDSTEQLLALSALLNSQAFGYLVSVQLARTELAQSYEVGLIQQTPVPDLTNADVAALARLARRAWSLKRTLDTTNETSHAFVLPPGKLGYEAVPTHPQAGGFSRAAIEIELTEIQRKIDEHAFSLYGISPEDRADVERATARRVTAVQTEDDEDEEQQSDETDNPVVGVPYLPIISWLVGVAFGRFDPRLASDVVQSYNTTGGTPYMLLKGRRPIPPEPEPFDPLPSRSPGMWPEGDAPMFVPPDIMVDDPGHDDDIHSHVASAAAKTGWPDPSDLRAWLAREFFPLHIKMYSKSRRKAPIYWQLATPSASYSVWLYIHAFSKDTLFRVQNDYVAPKLAHEERRLESLTSELRDSATAAQRKALAAQETLVEELRAFLEEVKRVAPLWNPNLDDGVILNFAPLWRLVPQNKAWQKELKSTWDALCDGKYDWGHLAMHLWPERVVPKCATDRSLAIAHGLEDVFWVEGEGGKWTARKTPTRGVDELVRERSSPAVKSALKSLLEAPAASGTAKKTKKGKANA